MPKNKQLSQTRYDSYIMESCNPRKNRIRKEKDTYFDDIYAENLANFLSDNNLTKKFIKELNLPNIKAMCSAASSARLTIWCFNNKENIVFEERSVRNGICRPNYDVHEGNVFYECKCHELFEKDNREFSEKYIPLFKYYFHKEYKSATRVVNKKDGSKVKKEYIAPTMNDFGISFGNDLSGYSEKFGFKQMLCHIFGLLTLDNKPTLSYIIFTPKKQLIDENAQIKDWLEKNEKVIKIIFEGMKKVPVFKNDKHYLLGDLVNFEYDFVEVCSIKDPLLETKA